MSEPDCILVSTETRNKHDEYSTVKKADTEVTEKQSVPTPITNADFEWWTDLIPQLDWVFAVTYADGAPHEYIAGQTEGISEEDFVRAARVIHTFGEPQKFYKETRIYLVHDGWKYWTMDRDHRDVALINRGRASHIYGVQNMPSTFSGTPGSYDGIATFWDTDLGVTDDESSTFLGLAKEVTGGYRKFRVLDIGAGTGLSLDLSITDAFRLTAVDPSQAMLNELVRKHPLVARVEPKSFSDALTQRSFAGTRFDLVLALGGSGSYLSLDDWAALPSLGKDRFIISVYGEGFEPITADLSAEALLGAREHARAFAAHSGGRIVQAGRFEVAVITAQH